MKQIVILLTLSWACQIAAIAEPPESPPNAATQTATTQQTIDKLLAVIAAHEARILELERRLGAGGSGVPDLPAVAIAAVPAADSATVPAAPQSLSAPPPPEIPAQQSADMGHNMSLPGGPVLNIRGFFDFNFGVGSIANPLIYPIIDNGCGTCGFPATPSHSAFQAGEFDLFMTSKLSDRLSFLGELVLGPSTTNQFILDIERYQLTYKVNRYFSASAGRMHTSIGYYNTAYHHGTWFSTAEGRPIMYLFEDSGGILPVHIVGLNFAGDVPHTETLGLHWIAEVGNGLSSNSSAPEAVQNFYSDRNYKATNLAAYISPHFLSGLQIGGSWYHDGLNPAGLPEVRQNIESGYIVYLTSAWEFLSEAVLQSNHVSGTAASFRNPMAYTQIARGFGIYKPYFRYQYVNDHKNDPVNLLKGTYYGPSVGMRIDFATYAALKLQFNHLFQSNQLAGNGLDAQLGFTF
jgi:hypothetical protein